MLNSKPGIIVTTITVFAKSRLESVNCCAVRQVANRMDIDLEAE
jgi:hypothetical protein